MSELNENYFDIEEEDSEEENEQQDISLKYRNIESEQKVQEIDSLLKKKI